MARRAAVVLDGLAAAGRIGARVQRRLDEGRIDGVDGVVQPPCALLSQCLLSSAFHFYGLYVY